MEFDAVSAGVVEPKESSDSLTGSLSIDVDVTPPIEHPWLFVNSSVRESPDHTRFLLHQSGGGGDLVLVSRAGESRRLTGLGSRFENPSWLPDGSAFLLTVQQANDGSPFSQQAAEKGLYLVPVTDGRAVKILSDRGGYFRMAWSPDGQSLAIVEDGDVYVYSRASGLRRLTQGAGHDSNQPGWSTDGNFIVAGGDLFDARTGSLIVSLIPPKDALSGGLNFDNRFFLASEEPWPVGNTDSPCKGPPLQNRTFSYDLQAGETKLLLDCDSGFFLAQGGPTATLPGTESGEVLLSKPTCWYCEATLKPWLLDIQTGELRAKTDDPKDDVRPIVSSDGSRAFVTSTHLRIYSADGAIEQDIGSPESLTFSGGVWSPDGERFAYVLGQAGY